jgi:hypothetical protein
MRSQTHTSMQSREDPEPFTVSLQTLAVRPDASRSSVRRWLEDAEICPIARANGPKSAIRYLWADVGPWLRSRRRVEWCPSERRHDISHREERTMHSRCERKAQSTGT